MDFFQEEMPPFCPKAYCIFSSMYVCDWQKKAFEIMMMMLDMPRSYVIITGHYCPNIVPYIAGYYDTLFALAFFQVHHKLNLIEAVNRAQKQQSQSSLIRWTGC